MFSRLDPRPSLSREMTELLGRVCAVVEVAYIDDVSDMIIYIYALAMGYE